MDKLNGVNLMRIRSSNCVDCPKELGCIGSACRYNQPDELVCEMCGDESADCEIDEYKLCRSCLHEYLLERFKEKSLEEQAYAVESDLNLYPFW